MLATLQELKDSQKLCELYIKTDTNLLKQGFADGYAVVRIDQILKLSKDEQRILCIYLSDDDEEPLVGYVENFDNDLVTLKTFNKYGQDDGVIVMWRK